ncbi:MAG: hypothetical protein JNL83_18405 [Myxococcales bacterium]|nr:hypothetical protein [Myxococcales bacterium]
MSASSRRTLRWIGGGLLIAGGIVGIWAAGTNQAATAAGTQPPPAPPGRASPPATSSVTSRPTIDPLDPDMLSSRSLRESLATYEAESIYPPTSHRWSAERAGERQPWNQPFPVEHLLDDRAGQETAVRFVADRHHVEHGQSLTSMIEVVSVARRTERLPIELRSAIVEAAGTGRTGIELVYRDDGRDGDAVAGDRIYTNRFVPGAEPALARARSVRLQVDLEAGGVERLIHLDFTYTPRPLLELAGVTGDVRDGSLVVTLDLQVVEPGAYQFDADVLASDGTTRIGWITTHWQELAAGRTRAELVLFGKVIRDQGIGGPFVIANLHAERRGDERDVAMWWSDPRSFSTRRIALDELSPDPWDSEERSVALASLRQAIAEQERAERGGAP